MATISAGGPLQRPENDAALGDHDFSLSGCFNNSGCVQAPNGQYNLNQPVLSASLRSVPADYVRGEQVTIEFWARVLGPSDNSLDGALASAAVKGLLSNRGMLASVPGGTVVGTAGSACINIGEGVSPIRPDRVLGVYTPSTQIHGFGDVAFDQAFDLKVGAFYKVTLQAAAGAVWGPPPRGISSRRRSCSIRLGACRWLAGPLFSAPVSSGGTLMLVLSSDTD